MNLILPKTAKFGLLKVLPTKSAFNFTWFDKGFFVQVSFFGSKNFAKLSELQSANDLARKISLNPIGTVSLNRLSTLAVFQ